MPIETDKIELPGTDMWDTLFSRDKKPFADDLKLYIDPSTQRHYSYTALKQASTHFAASLHHAFSFKKGYILALFLQNSIDTPAITFGTHYLGGVVSPANPAYTVRELVHHLRDSGAKILCTQTSLLKVALEAAREVEIPKERVIVVDAERDGEGGLRAFGGLVEKGKKGEQVRKVEVDAERDLAYLVYSSGTTGLPKGVMLTHGNVVGNLGMLDMREGEIVLGSGSGGQNGKVLSVLPFYHIYGLQCLVHLPAYTGFTTYVMQSFDLKRFCEIIQEYKITYSYIAPPVVLHLAKNPIVDEYDLSSLKTITSGAAPLTKDLIHAVHKRLKVGTKQAYGLSETSPAVFIQKQWDNGIGSNGPALPNQIIKYVSDDGKEVKRGEQGELWIKGPHVFVGYHNNYEATKACMTPDGFFKTGDIAYEDERGNMYITDRVKELIKYKGFQVAPAELEGLLMGMELVDDVAVIGVYDDSKATEVPMAFVVLKNGVERSEESGRKIVKWVEEKVAGHKRLRGGVRFVDAVPKSASGKILRRVLKDMLKEEEKMKKGGEGKAKL